MIIVGLGNPGVKYEKTHHNAGFIAVDYIADKMGVKFNKKGCQAEYGFTSVNGEQIVLAKPQTYMNLSGEAVRDFKNFYKVNSEDVIVIYDDLDIEPGIIKIRKKGGPGTHNGMKSVVNELQTEEFPRIRVGIGNPEYKNDLLNYILTKIPDEDYKILETAISNSADAIEEILKNGIDSAMNKFN